MKTSNMKITAKKRDTRGQALVEMALLLPLLLLLVIGILEFGRAWYYKQQVNNAAREAARILVVTKPWDASYSCITSIRSIYNLKPVAQWTITPSTTPSTGATVSVTLGKNFATIVPNFPPFNQIPTSIEATVKMRYEQ